MDLYTDSIFGRKMLFLSHRLHSTLTLKGRAIKMCPSSPVGIADPHLTPIGGEQEVRVHLGEVGKGGVIDRCERTKRAIHEVGDGRGFHHGHHSYLYAIVF